MASRASSKSKASKTTATKAQSKAKDKKPMKKVAAAAAPKAAPGKKVSKVAAKVAAKVPSKSPNKSGKTVKRSAPIARSASRKTAPAARYHTVTPFLNVKGANDAIEFYKRAFGAEERSRMPNPDGSIMHAEIVIGDSTIMLSDTMPAGQGRGRETRSSIHLTVTDCDALFERAVSAGGTQKMAPQDMFWGDRYGELEDPFGNVWSIATHKEDVTPEEVARRAAAFAPPPPDASETAPVVE